MEKSNGNGKLIEHRLTKLEVNVNEIKNNHLPHIERKVDWLIGLVITSLIAIIVSFIK